MSRFRVLGREFARDAWTNVTPKILGYLGRRLHLRDQHPLGLVRRAIADRFAGFAPFDRLDPVVTVEQNFDSLLVPPGHASRAKTDCYYLDARHLLRAHTTAHQSELLARGHSAFLVVGEAFRRDEIDRLHYPVFHQVDGVKCFGGDSAESLVEREVKSDLGGLVSSLLGAPHRWVDAHFPFTRPSWELELLSPDGEWTELLGCGLVRDEILERAGRGGERAYAFGLGLERIAMALYDIPDIRLFWSEDEGFLSQFAGLRPGERYAYRPVSTYPPCPVDLSFWLPDGRARADFADNDFFDVVRQTGGDAVERASLVDEFVHPKTGATSLCFRIVYRRPDRTLTKSEANEIHARVASAAVDAFKVRVR